MALLFVAVLMLKYILKLRFPTSQTPKMARTKSVYLCYQPKGETYGGLGGAAHPKIKNGIFSSNFLGFSYISWAILKSFIYVALILLLFAPAKYYVVYERSTEVSRVS